MARLGGTAIALVGVGVPIVVAYLVGRSDWGLGGGIALGAAILAAAVVWLQLQRTLARHWRAVGTVVGTSAGRPQATTVAAVVALRQQSYDAGRERVRLASVIDALPHGILVVDAGGVIQLANRFTETLLGTVGLVGRNLSEVIAAGSLRQLIDVTVQRERADEVDLQLPLPGGITGTAEGDEGVLLAQASPCAWQESPAALVMLTDVTRVRRLEQMRRDFVANVSHELRTPITAINGFVETILDNRMYQSQEARHFLEIARRQAQRMDAIIGDLLVLTNLEVGEERADVVLEETALAPILHAATQLCQGAASDQHLSLEISCDPELTCRMNAQLVEQALINLIHNAIKHSGSGSSVELSVSQAAGTIAIVVRDSGVGIASEHHQRIFERFYRVERARSGDQLGTGLGLAIVKHIALLHHGQVTLVSTPGQGSTFSLLLPN